MVAVGEPVAGEWKRAFGDWFLARFESGRAVFFFGVGDWKAAGLMTRLCRFKSGLRQERFLGHSLMVECAPCMRGVVVRFRLAPSFY